MGYFIYELFRELDFPSSSSSSSKWLRLVVLLLCMCIVCVCVLLRLNIIFIFFCLLFYGLFKNARHGLYIFDGERLCSCIYGHELAQFIVVSSDSDKKADEIKWNSLSTVFTHYLRGRVERERRWCLWRWWWCVKRVIPNHKINDLSSGLHVWMDTY